MKFVHAADVHLDSPLRGLDRYDGAPVERFRGATRQALRNLVDLVLEEKADFLLIAGDLYNGIWRVQTGELYPYRHIPIVPLYGPVGLAIEWTLLAALAVALWRGVRRGPALWLALYPPTHGARRNGVRMREDVPVLAEELRDAGYTSAAFISNWTLKSRLSGTNRGFDLYDD